jgi:hypothetical protein
MLSHKIGEVMQNFGGVEHFIRGITEILGGLTPPPPPPVNPPMQSKTLQHGTLQFNGLKLC